MTLVVALGTVIGMTSVSLRVTGEVVLSSSSGVASPTLPNLMGLPLVHMISLT